MKKLYFRYGAMNCGKTTALIQSAHNYEENDMKVLLIKPSIDTKAECNVSSRIGIERKVDFLLGPDESLLDTKEKVDLFKSVECVFVDEAQFLSEAQVDELWEITKKHNIPVICYGLRTDFTGRFFTGSKRLFEVADEFDELITICKCGSKARFNARFVNDEFTLDGESVLIDGSIENVEYRPMCGNCYINHKIELKNKTRIKK